MFAVKDVINFLAIMHALLNVYFHLELRRLVHNLIRKRNDRSASFSRELAEAFTRERVGY